ncbi:MAG: EAL domain-containing protein [Gallionella sp.]|nr:EAL domain-containing protein [Gallionella sp.]MDD4947220.1 EAL domain-containing protein [Gallionella sp.]
MELTLADIMNKHVQHVTPDCSLAEAAKRMAESHISSLLVVADNILVGIITERDLLRLINSQTDRQTPLSEIMSAPVLTGPPDMKFTEGYIRVLNHHVRHLAVVGAHGELLGLVSETDFRTHIGSEVLQKLDDVNAVMDTELTILPPDASLEQGIACMLRNGTSYALVVEHERAVGILTERDMAQMLLSDRTANEIPLREIWHAPVVSISRRTPVIEIAGLMQSRKLRHLGVIDDNGKVIGMVTQHKLMGYLAASQMNEQSLLRQQALESSQQHTELLLNTIMQAIPDLIWMKNSKGVYLGCNRTCERFFGVSEAEIIGKTDFDLLDKETADLFHDQLIAVITTGKPDTREVWVNFAEDEHRVCLEVIRSPMFDADGNLAGVMGVARDITERKTAEAKTYRFSQLYNALSQCNQAIVRCKSEQELFDSVCQSAVQYGGMRMAWIGMLDGQQVVPVSSYGESEVYLKEIKVSSDADCPYGRGPTGTAIRENRPYWCQDYQHDPAVIPWRERDNHPGWGASAALPLCRNGKVVGAFTLYASEANSFDEKSQALLAEMAMDIGFALDNFHREALRVNLERQSAKERAVLEWLAKGEPLSFLLNQLAMHYEAQYPGTLCSVLLMSADGKQLQHGVAPSLPASYCKAIDGVSIGAQVGSCGTAAYTGQTVIVSDITRDPLWADFRNLALSYGLAACWSIPIISTKNQVLGTFALYSRFPCSPSQDELYTLERGAHLASLAIERAQTENTLSKLSQAVEQSPSTVVITDLNANIEYANASFTRTTGYQLSEVLGMNPRILHSGKTPKVTYDDMWAHLSNGQPWKGEFINRRKDGSEFIESVRISPLRLSGGEVTNYLAIKEDITEQKQAAARIQQLAHFDFLTGLPNQTLLKSRVSQSMNLAQRSNTGLAVLFMDLDHFKNVNDTLGHRIGDELLIQLAIRLQALLREEDTLSRMGGDEFVLVLPNTDADGAAHVAEKVLSTVAQSFHIEQYELVVTPSIGIAMYPNDGTDFDKLYQSADVAMYRAKLEGRNSFRFFTSEMQQRSARRLLLENALRHALDRQQLQLYYQPQVSMQDGKIIGAEALLRWHHPELGAISPAEFIPVAEESGLILSIGEWVLRTTAEQLRRWQEQGLPLVTIAVNLSAVQFRHPHLPELIKQILAETGVCPQHIELELTESVAMDTPLAAIAVMDELHACGIRMSIDDFGTGYSSLSYLKKFKVNKLKIDQSFVRNITEDAESRALVTAIITLSSSLGFQTIAEGVETASQLAFLRLQGCDEAQGYYFSKPLNLKDFEQYILAQSQL